jgi:hypothetical protein
LTHEVENSGDGRSSQQSEVQTVTFNAGRGLGGTATLTYNDLYGQSWTTRPFNVGGDNMYRLELSIAPGTSCSAVANECKLKFRYGSTANVQTITVNDDASYAITASLSAQSLREGLLKLFAPYATSDAYVGKDRGNTIYVSRHHSATSVKLGGSISAATRLTYDIYLPVDMSGHDDNGQMTGDAAHKGLTVEWHTAAATARANTRELKLFTLGDRSAEIESALTSLPNQVIPSVSVTKVGVTDIDTNSDGADGNVYAQSYAIAFNNEANSGDQNMLTCNASPCDEDGCINRGPGVSEVRYMHHDHQNHGEGINFVNQGYFIMDVGTNAVTTSLILSAGTIRIMWDTGAGISSAEFAVVATAAEVQTALRTITGWEAVTVELWGTYSSTLTVTNNHQFKVTFAAGYDDLGKAPTFATLSSSDGAYAAPVPSTVRARLYDQRFSNSIWLGKTTGYVHTTVDGSNVGTLTFTPASSSTAAVIQLLPENGDVWVVADVPFGTGSLDAGSSEGAPSTDLSTGADMGTERVLHNDLDQVSTIKAAAISAAGKNHAFLYEGATSVQTSDYFAVGARINVLGSTWSSGYTCADAADVGGTGGALATKALCNAASTCGTGNNQQCVWAQRGVGTDTTITGNNKYRHFKVTGHVTNLFNREFAKLDSFPADDGITPSTTNADKPDYYLKITSNNGTVHNYHTRKVSATPPTNEGLPVQVTVNEIQIIVLGTGENAANDDQVWKLYYKGEESQNMDWKSSPAQVAEEINGFSALSGPVTVEGKATATDDTTGFPRYEVTFDAKDGDVAELTVAVTSGNNDVYVFTQANGWSIEAPVSAGLDTMQAGGIINITAQEVCTFAPATNQDGTFYFCYDGICGKGTTTAVGATNGLAAVKTILDDNGDQILKDATATGYAITMPMGKSCDGLEMRHDAGGTTSTISKSVNKHNNGKSFRITRSFLKSEAVTLADTGYVGATALDTINLPSGSGHALLKGVDSVLIAGTACDLGVPATDGAAGTAFSRVTTASSTPAGTAATILKVAALANVDDENAACVFRIARHVITLDSLPTASAVGTKKILKYTSPVGSCSVAETTKGTYESYECSNRGACDGKSGLCTCYEGYSGQSCQTQTVLV